MSEANKNRPKSLSGLQEREQNLLYLESLGWIFDKVLLVQIEKLYPEFFLMVLAYVKVNPDATHLIYDQTSTGGQAIVLAIHQKLLDTFGFLERDILGQTIWFFVSRAYGYIPNQFWERFIIQQQERGQAARQLIENLPDVDVPIDTTGSRKVKSPGLYFVTIHRELLFDNKEKGIIRVISLRGIDKKLDKDVFNNRVIEWERNLLLDAAGHKTDEYKALHSEIPTAILDLIDGNFAKENEVLPLELIGNTLTLHSCGKSRCSTVAEQLTRKYGYQIHFIEIDRETLQTLIAYYYSIESYKKEESKQLSDFVESEAEIGERPQDTEPISRVPNEALAVVLTARELLKGLENPLVPERGPEHDLLEEIWEEELAQKKKESTSTEISSVSHTIGQSYSESYGESESAGTNETQTVGISESKNVPAWEYAFRDAFTGESKEKDKIISEPLNRNDWEHAFVEAFIGEINGSAIKQNQNITGFDVAKSEPQEKTIEEENESTRIADSTDRPYNDISARLQKNDKPTDEVIEKPNKTSTVLLAEEVKNEVLPLPIGQEEKILATDKDNQYFYDFVKRHWEQYNQEALKHLEMESKIYEENFALIGKFLMVVVKALKTFIYKHFRENFDVIEKIGNLASTSSIIPTQRDLVLNPSIMPTPREPQLPPIQEKEQTKIISKEIQPKISDIVSSALVFHTGKELIEEICKQERLKIEALVQTKLSRERKSIPGTELFHLLNPLEKEYFLKLATALLEENQANSKAHQKLKEGNFSLSVVQNTKNKKIYTEQRINIYYNGKNNIFYPPTNSYLDWFITTLINH